MDPAAIYTDWAILAKEIYSRVEVAAGYVLNNVKVPTFWVNNWNYGN